MQRNKDDLNDSRQTLLLVDDEPTNLHVLRHTLQSDYRLLFAKSGQAALDLARSDPPDLILLDVMMPAMSGYEVCATLKQESSMAEIPVIFVTALADAENEQQGLELGAVDYITKPFSPHIVQARVRTHLSLVRAQELQETRLKIVQCLGAAAEYKDNETGLHVIRMSNYAKIIAIAAGYSSREANDLLHAAPMHDVGKIGIPDAILCKPGALTADEWRVMQQHSEIGAKIIGNHTSRMLRMAASIALSHHEKWDGSGYPNRLARDDIPHAARIVAIADVFDALTSVRPYKNAWSPEDAAAHIRSESGKHFDPELVEIFMECLPQILEVRAQWMDEDVIHRG
ncbi:two-component system response regulator [Herbaspirillum lusitanum]|uniref:response regulator n=1 Tax=Herbaspirillum lusitanum TaxID=213312 RepID=UPI00223812A1|nr:two-component system response regulator [Herbaspirillum lusitanum]MCW5299803.1 two-component system response regulator [Herbaspirillum lusitanum]